MSLIDYFAIHIVPRMYRGKGALHPAHTGKLTDVVSCVREYDVNIFFLIKGETLIAIDAGYKSYPRLLERCRKIGVDPARVQALREKLDLAKIRYVFTSHNGFTDDPQSAFRHIDTIPTLEKGCPFDETAPYDCFEESEE